MRADICSGSMIPAQLFLMRNDNKDLDYASTVFLYETQLDDNKAMKTSIRGSKNVCHRASLLFSEVRFELRPARSTL
jgi:hypothetical protein